MDLASREFDELAKLIHSLTGLVISVDKSYLIKHRLEPVAKRFGCDSFEAFLSVIRKSGGTRIHDAIIEAVTTKETSFFRDSWLFEALGQHVLPELAKRLDGTGTRRNRIRIWSAGCATGQEAYSLAMLVRELVDNQPQTRRLNEFSILASDISSDAIETARSGLYSATEIQRGISEGRLRRNLERAGTRWQFAGPLRELIQCRKLDLLRPPHDLGAFDLVLCRNVLIYFDQPSRQRVCSTVEKHLLPGSFFVLGSAESLYGCEHSFETIKHGRAVIYRKPAASR